MKNRLIYLLIIFSAFAFERGAPIITKWVIINGCSLKVEGSTNINNFACDIVNYSKPDTILVTRSGNQPVQLNGSIQLDVENFDCHNRIMTADLRKTLKVKEFPKLIIRFISISKYPGAGNREDIARGAVSIELAGISKTFEIDYKVGATESPYIVLIGSRKLNFSDFNITPPRKLGGMIRTNNELSVLFVLKMKALN